MPSNFTDKLNIKLRSVVIFIANFKMKTWQNQLLGSLPLDFYLPLSINEPVYMKYVGKFISNGSFKGPFTHPISERDFEIS